MHSSTGRPSVIVVTGPSGAGKGTLIKKLLERVPELEVAVSATTRDQRPGEIDGRDYHFLAEPDFRDRIATDRFIEWVEYVSGHLYGTLRSEIEKIAARGRVCLLELETEGAARVKQKVDGAVTIFISAPVDELERRLRERATESSGEIGERIALARRQLDQQHEFDYVVENDQVERAADRLTEIVHRELAAAGTIPTR